MEECSSFSTSLSASEVPCVLILAILSSVRWNLRVVLICIFMMIRMLNISLGASQPFSIPQLIILCLVLYPIFNRVIWFSRVLLLEFFAYIGYYFTTRCRICKDLFPICCLPFCLIDSVLCLTEALQFYVVPFVNS